MQAAPVNFASTQELDAVIYELVTFVVITSDEYPLQSCMKLILIEQWEFFYHSTEERLTCPI